MSMRAAVLLSGGVDSSVALRLVQEKEEVEEITAFYLKIWLEDELAFLGECPWEEDLKHARAVCEQAGVALRVVSLQSEYQERVVTHVVSELRAGRTPSPDILCNQWVKFGLFLDRIGNDYDKVVSGHYAQVEQGGGRWWLKRSPDPIKDQTYFLSALNQAQLGRAWFPVGGLRKAEVRQLAERFWLPNRGRRDSQGICFLGKIKYADFVRHHLGERPGGIYEVESGRKLGEHSGWWFHTIGQRKGLGLSGGPWYVVGKDLEANAVWVAHGDGYREQACACFTAGPVHWISGDPGAVELQVKLRHGPQMTRCRLERREGGMVEVQLEEKDQGIAPGQSAIFYEGEYCLGGGMIQEREGISRAGRG